MCSDPPMLSISVRPERYSYDIINTSREFVVNVPSRRQVRAVDWCGMVSGRKVDKFEGAGLTPSETLKVSCPIILECPINIECRVREELHLGTHTMFVGRSRGRADFFILDRCQWAVPAGKSGVIGLRPRTVFFFGCGSRPVWVFRKKAKKEIATLKVVVSGKTPCDRLS